MIFNENFAIGEQYVTNSGEMFRVVDVENTSDIWFSVGKHSSIVFRRVCTYHRQPIS